MKRLALGATATVGAVFVLRRLVPKVRSMHAHCRETMRTQCGGACVSCKPY